MNVWRLLGSIGLDTSEWDRAIDDTLAGADKAGKGIEDKLGKRAKAAEAQLLALGNAAKNLGAALTLGVTAPLLAIAGAGVRSAMQLETFAASLEVLIGDGERAAEVFEQLYEFSATTPFDWKSLTEATRTLAGFQIQAEGIIPALSQMGDVAAGLQIPLNDLAQIYGRINVTGRAGMEEINRLADRGVPIFTELAKVLGVSTSQVRDYVSAGKVGFPEIEQVFKNMTSEGGQFFGLMEAQMATTEGRIATLKDTFEQVSDAIGERLLPAVNALIGFLQQGVDWFNELSEAQKDTIIVVGGLAAGLGPLLFLVGKFLIALPQLRAQLVAVRAALLAIRGPFLILTLAAAALYAAWRTNFLGIQDVVAKAAAWIGKAINTISEFGTSFIRNWELVKFTVAAIWESMGYLAQHTGNLIVGYFQVAIATVQGAFAVMGAAITKVFTDAANGVIRGINWLVDQGSDLLGLLGVQINRIPELQSSTWADVTDEMARRTAEATGKIAHAQEGIRSELRQTGTLVKTTLGAIIDDMGRVEEAGEGIATGLDLPTLTDDVDDLNRAVGDLSETIKAIPWDVQRLSSTSDLRAEEDAAQAFHGQSKDWEAIRAKQRQDQLEELKLALELQALRERGLHQNALRIASTSAGIRADEDALQAQHAMSKDWDAIRERQRQKALEALKAEQELEAFRQKQIDAATLRQVQASTNLRMEEDALQAAHAQGRDWDALRESQRQKALDALRAEQELDAFRQRQIDAVTLRAVQSATSIRMEEDALQAAHGQSKDWEALRARQRADALAALKAEQELAAFRQKYVDELTLRLISSSSSLRADEDAAQAQHGQGKDWEAIRAQQQAEERRKREEAAAGAAQAHAEAAAAAAEAWLAAEARREAIVDNFTGRLLDATTSAVPAFGAALEGFATGGPLGALTAMLGELLTGSDAFKSLLESANSVLAPLIEAITKVVDALQPVIDVALALVDGALQPLVMILTKVVAPVFTFVARIVASIWNAIARVLNTILGWAGVNLKLIDLNRDTSTPVTDPISEPRDPFEETKRRTTPKEQGFGGTSQSIQLAVATPLVEASYLMLQAATMQRDLFTGLTGAGAGAGLDALPPFTDALNRATPVLEKIANEGIRLELGGIAIPPPQSSAPTAALR